MSLSEDIAVKSADARVLYEHLSGDSDERCYRQVVSPDAVHCMLISNPKGLLDSLGID